MYLQNDERRPRMSSGFALRVAILGGAALLMFAVIFFRLWYLQVLSATIPRGGKQQPIR